MTTACEQCPLRNDLIECARQLSDKAVDAQAALGMATLEADMAMIATDDAALMGNLDAVSIDAHNQTVYALSDAIDLHQFTARVGADTASELVRDSDTLIDFCTDGPRKGIKVPLLGIVGLPGELGKVHCTSGVIKSIGADLSRGKNMLTEGRASEHRDTKDFRRTMRLP
jgi:hypothetical protein